MDQWGLGCVELIVVVAGLRLPAGREPCAANYVGYSRQLINGKITDINDSYFQPVLYYAVTTVTVLSSPLRPTAVAYSRIHTNPDDPLLL